MRASHWGSRHAGDHVVQAVQTALLPHLVVRVRLVDGREEDLGHESLDADQDEEHRAASGASGDGAAGG